MKRFMIALLALATTAVSMESVEAQRLFRRSSRANCCQPATPVRTAPTYRTKVVTLYRVRPVVTQSYAVIRQAPVYSAPVCSTPVYSTPVCSSPVYHPPAAPVYSQCATSLPAYPTCSTQPIYDVAATSYQSDAIPIASSIVAAPMESVMSTDTSFKPAIEGTAEASSMTYEEVRDAFTNYVETSPDVNSVCDMKSEFPAYGAVIETLQDFEKLGYEQGAPVCFPSKRAWETRSEVKAKVIQALTDGGVL